MLLGQLPAQYLEAQPPQPAQPLVQVSLQFVPPLEKPDYDKEVLQPLYAAQEAQREREAAEAARIAEEERQRAYQAALAAQAAVSSQTSYPQPTGDAKAFIYAHESGNNPASTNSSGCRGLGQACPGSKLPCTDYDYACQDAWFTNYMQSRYGTWENALAFWLRTDPRPYPGHWW